MQPNLAGFQEPSSTPKEPPCRPAPSSTRPEWKSTACILCECNCGIEVQLGGEDGRRFTRIRGDKQHPLSKGYACEKANRLDFYQNGRDRITSPLRRRPDGSFEEIDWDTAIREVAEKLAAVRDEHGGDKIFYYGGGGQGNHLPGAYSRSTLAALGSVYKSNALAQEKTGEFLGRRSKMLRHHRPAATSSTAKSASSSARTPGSRTRSRTPA